MATVAIAWRTDAAAGAVPIAAVFACIVIVRWALAPEIAYLIAPAGASGIAAPQPWNADIGPHIGLGILFAALFGAGGFLAQGRSQSPFIPILWSAASVATPILILIALYYRIAGFERSIPFAGLALLLAAINGYATETLGKRAPSPGIAASGALYAVGTVAALALALTFALEKGWLTVALALMVPGIAWIADERPLPMLRTLAAAAVGAGGGAGRLGAAHRRQRCRHHAHFQLDPVRLRRSRDLASGSAGICCASAPTTSPRAWSTAPRSCSPC